MPQVFDIPRGSMWLTAYTPDEQVGHRHYNRLIATFLAAARLGPLLNKRHFIAWFLQQLPQPP